MVVFPSKSSGMSTKYYSVAVVRDVSIYIPKYEQAPSAQTIQLWSKLTELLDVGLYKIVSLDIPSRREQKHHGISNSYDSRKSISSVGGTIIPLCFSGL
jgi:hypothetical protein